MGYGTYGTTYLATIKDVVEGSVGKTKLVVNVTIKEINLDWPKHIPNWNMETTSDYHDTAPTTEPIKFDKSEVLREAEILASLHHDHIARLIDVFEENHSVYLG